MNNSFCSRKTWSISSTASKIWNFLIKSRKVYQIMKKTLSLILAALLLASSLTACGGGQTKETNKSETDAVETKAPATKPVATDPVDTDAPVVAPSFPTNLVTENGAAMAKIVLSASATDLEKYAAEELRYHIEKVSGASLEVVTEAPADVLSMVIGTPDSHPELAELFPEDIAWITTLEEDDGRQWGDDGFAIRQMDGTLYIFGATPRGALNGVYDFIEENMGVLWLRANEEKGMIYDEQPTVTITSVNYREKSPFQVRGWHLCGEGANGEGHSDPATEIMMSRNKLNRKFAEVGCNEQCWPFYESIGVPAFNIGHNLKYWVKNSPTFDPECTEYWNVDNFGKPISEYSEFSQVNWWSDLTADTIAASIIDYLGKYNTKSISVGVEDNDTISNPPMSEERYEYAPGQFVERNDSAYLSTVFFSFLNRIARQVGEVYPDVTINTFAYWLTENPPLCEIEDNIAIVIAPILEDMSSPITDPDNRNNVGIHLLMEKWKDTPHDVTIYNYYGSSAALKLFERPIWDRIQADFRYYAEIGFDGTMPEGLTDARGSTATWDMNTLTFWIYSKLAWNPEEDVDALIKTFCDRYYGEASDEMQEYYALLEKGWAEGESETYLWNFKLTADYYYDTFIYCTDLEDDMAEVLNRAYEAAAASGDNAVMERILPIKTNYETMLAMFEE